jgi:hypothetical protein
MVKGVKSMKLLRDWNDECPRLRETLRRAGNFQFRISLENQFFLPNED